MTITVSLSNIQAARDQLNECQDWILEKTRELAKELAKAGIQTAQNNVGVWGRYVEFLIETEETATGCIATLIMRDTMEIVSKYDSRPVSGSLMAEFGAGKFAVDPTSSFPNSTIIAGRGTFPEQTHAFDPKGWSYRGNDDKWHHSYGVKPTRPMYKAYVRLQDVSAVK